MIRRNYLLTKALLLFILNFVAASANEPQRVDPSTLHHKVLCGYQGWFRCPGDAANQGWRHWSRNGTAIDPRTVTFEMWPDTSELNDDEKYQAEGFVDSNGKPASLFSSVHPKTVDRHFQWMQQYGIDGVFLQRFLVDLENASVDQVLENVRGSAKAHGRAFGICYDLSGMPNDKLYERLISDWKKLVDEKNLTKDECYLHHNGKPVVFVWGFFSERFEPELAHCLIDFFQNDPQYGVTLIGGCQWWWRTEKNPEWARAFRRLDVISPWNVGNSTMINKQKHAATQSWKTDLDEARSLGRQYLPVIYPGFGWTNLKGAEASKSDIPRLGGDFYWRQFSKAADLGIEMAYVAMFDEVDEATAIFKVSNTPPTPGRFKTYDKLPSDWYLRLTGEGTKLLRGDRKNSSKIPIKP